VPPTTVPITTSTVCTTTLSGKMKCTRGERPDSLSRNGPFPSVIRSLEVSVLAGDDASFVTD
jgi:hypothetical protein